MPPLKSTPEELAKDDPLINSRGRSQERSSTSVNVGDGHYNQRFAWLPIGDLRPHPKNPRKHSRQQVRAIARSMATFGNNAPILVDRNGQIVGGEARWEAAKLRGYTTVPVVFLDHLTEAEATAYMLADNKLVDWST